MGQESLNRRSAIAGVSAAVMIPTVFNYAPTLADDQPRSHVPGHLPCKLKFMKSTKNIAVTINGIKHEPGNTPAEGKFIPIDIQMTPSVAADKSATSRTVEITMPFGYKPKVRLKHQGTTAPTGVSLILGEASYQVQDATMGDHKDHDDKKGSHAVKRLKVEVELEYAKEDRESKPAKITYGPCCVECDGVLYCGSPGICIDCHGLEICCEDL